MKTANLGDGNYKVIAIALFVAIMTALIFLPALGNGFVTWDDNEYVYNNLKITRLDSDFLTWAFTTPQVGMYAPLTMLSLGIDYFFWNLRPSGYHLTNLVFHVMNTFLVVLCLASIIQAAVVSRYLRSFSYRKTLIASGLTGLLFGIHPLHVESVVWVSERKDVLYAFFFLLSVLAYLRYATSERRRGLFYTAALASFVLSLLSKSMAVTLPAVLILLDIYPLKRLFRGEAAASVGRVFIEKVPFFTLGILFSVLAVLTQQAAGAGAPVQFTLWDGILTSSRAIFFYLQKLLFPFDLSPFYPLFLPISLTIKDIIILIVLSGISIFCFTTWHRNRVWMISWLYYLVSILPASGIMQVGGQAAADRYTYMPLLGPMALIGAGTALAAEKIGTYSQRRIFPGFVAAILLGLLALTATATARQIGVWKDGLTLWKRVFEIYPDNTPPAYRGRAEAYYKSGDFGRAIADYSEAVRLDPLDYRSYSSRGIIYFISGKNDLALDDFNAALRIEPYDGRAIYYRGLICRGIGSRPPACY